MFEDVKTLNILFGLVTAAGVMALAVFVHFRFAPTFKLTVEPRWEGEDGEYLVVRYIVENVSKIRIFLPVFLSQIAFHSKVGAAGVGPRLPLAEVEKSKKNSELFIGPEQINSNKSKFYPGERIYWEKLYLVPSEMQVAHVTLTARVALGRIGKLVTLKKEPWLQSVSNISVRDAPNKRLWRQPSE